MSSKATDGVTCCIAECATVYHRDCVGVSTKLQLTRPWTCTSCMAKKPRNNANSTPVRAADFVEDTGNNTSITGGSVYDFESFEAKLLQKLDGIISSSIKSELKPLQKNLSALTELTQSVEFMSTKFDEIYKDFSCLRSETQTLRAENTKLQEQMKDMTVRMSRLEQQARENNIELQCVPEHPRENLISTVSQLSSVVSAPVSKSDIISCIRVAKSNPNSSRPRAIIVKLSSSDLRDSLLASCWKYNKENSANKLNSSDLGIAGEKQPIYVSEHLSPSNRALHAQARSFKKDNHFKFLWIRNGRILMKKDESSATLWVKSEEFLKSLKPDTTSI